MRCDLLRPEASRGSCSRSANRDGLSLRVLGPPVHGGAEALIDPFLRLTPTPLNAAVGCPAGAPYPTLSNRGTTSAVC